MSHDQQSARHSYYVPDTEIADVPWQPPPRAEDEDEVDMKVMLDDGAWHDELDHTETVCEKPIPGGGWRVPSKQVEPGAMCTGCFFPSEIRRRDAALAVDAEDQRAHEDGMAPSNWREPRKPTSLGDAIDRGRKRSERIVAITKKPNGAR